MSEMQRWRPGFAAIVEGWTLIDGLEDITDRIDRVIAWTNENGPLLPSEQATVKFMIECQIAREFGRDKYARDDDDDE